MRAQSESDSALSWKKEKTDESQEIAFAGVGRGRRRGRRGGGSEHRGQGGKVGSARRKGQGRRRDCRVGPHPDAESRDAPRIRHDQRRGGVAEFRVGLSRRFWKDNGDVGDARLFREERRCPGVCRPEFPRLLLQEKPRLRSDFWKRHLHTAQERDDGLDEHGDMPDRRHQQPAGFGERAGKVRLCLEEGLEGENLS